MAELEPARFDIQHLGEAALEADGDVAQADRPVTVLEQGAGDDADGVGEVDDPGIGRGLAHASGDVEDHRDRAQGLGQPARSGGLLADAAALQRPGLVLLARSLSADPQLHQHCGDAVQCRLQLGRGGDPGRMAEPLQDPPPERTDQLEPFLGRVDQDQLLDRQQVSEPADPVDQLRCVRRPAADHRDPHPFTPVRVTPSMNARWAKKKRMITGAMTSRVAAIVRFQFVWWALLNVCSP